MHINFGDLGEIQIEDVCHRVDVEASRRDVCGHQHRDLPGLERLERALALPLTFVPMNCRGHQALTRKALHHLVCAVFRSGKRKSPGAGSVSQKGGE